jgi:hypothetical protein
VVMQRVASQISRCDIGHSADCPTCSGTLPGSLLTFAVAWARGIESRMATGINILSILTGNQGEKRQRVDTIGRHIATQRGYPR